VKSAVESVTAGSSVRFYLITRSSKRQCLFQKNLLYRICMPRERTLSLSVKSQFSRRLGKNCGLLR